MLQTIITVIQLIACLTIVVIVLIQSGKSSGLSAVTGGSSESFLSKNKSRTLDARLARLTKWVASVFMVLTLILNLI